MSAGAKGGISHEQALALLIVADGCDVYSPHLARVLRGIEQQFPHLVDITSPMMPSRGKWDTAYFGAISTPVGVRCAQRLAEWGIAVTIDEEVLLEEQPLASSRAKGRAEHQHRQVTAKRRRQ
jgi:hypothetical protein